MDLHIHGVEGFDTQTDSVADILSMARLEGAEGVSEILLSLYPGPIPAMRRWLSAVKEAMEKQRSGFRGKTLSSNMPHFQSNTRPSARILGAHLEGPFLNPARCGALDPGTFLTPSWDAYRELAEGFADTIKVVTLAPELHGAPELIKRIVNSGTIVTMGHTDATYAEAEAGFRAGAKGVTHLFNAMRPFTHREPGIAGFALTNPDVYVEIIADPHHLHLETIRLVFRAKPQNRILIVSDSVKGTGVGPLKKEGQSIKAADVELDPPVCTERGNLQGGSMSIAKSSARLIDEGFDETAVTGAIIENPARFLRG
jgi:N-acetylglucosamine-6-phosphate deacetylase